MDSKISTPALIATLLHHADELRGTEAASAFRFAAHVLQEQQTTIAELRRQFIGVQFNPRVLVVSIISKQVVGRTLWADWAIDNGETLSLTDLADIADELRRTGQYLLDNHVLINADWAGTLA